MSGFSKKDRQFRQFAQEGPPLRVVLHTCTPLALYQAMQSVFKLLDSLMASYIGAQAVSAVSALSQITLMVTALGSGLAIGGSIRISEAYGRGDEEAVRSRVSTVYFLALAVSVLIVGILIPFAEGFLRLLQTPESLIAEGAGYFRIEILTLVVQFINTVYIAIARSRGQAKRILGLNMLVIAVKLGLSAVFVYLLHCGVTMIAVATLISQLLLLVLAAADMMADEGVFRFRLKNVRLDRDTLGPILSMSYPVSAEKVLFALGKVVVNAMSGGYGSLTVGALGISNNIGGLTVSLHQGFTDGGAPLISQNRGAGKHRRTLGIYYRLLAVDVAIGAVGLTLVSWGLPWLAEVFARSQNSLDSEFCAQIIAIHKWEMLGYITLGINAATTSLLLGYGYTRLTMLLNVARVFVYRVPVLWVFQNFTSIGAEAVGMTMMVSNVCTGLTALVIAVPVILRIRKCANEQSNPNSQGGNLS